MDTERLRIVVDDLSGPEIAALLTEHVEEMRATSPPESKHALDLAGLRQPEVTFWSVYAGDVLVGCGALKELDPGHGELKSMRTARSHLGRGVASALLRHIIAEARRRGYHRISLETGAMGFFAPARALYAKHGFTPCAPFAQYVEDPNSVFLTTELWPAAPTRQRRTARRDHAAPRRSPGRSRRWTPTRRARPAGPPPRSPRPVAGRR